ncbi:aspartic proteinase-like protein 2 [Tanacetum coccineum]
MLGFGQANSSVLSQLASEKKVRKIFSHCLDGSQGGGIFAIGQVVQPKVQTTPMIPEAHYNVDLKAIEVGGDVLQLPTYIFDVGENEEQLLTVIDAAQPNIRSHIVEQQFTCYKYFGNVDRGFPDVIFHFENSLSLKVSPSQYLFEVADQDWCVGFQDSDLQSQGKEITLLGDLVLTDKLVTYDLEKKTIGWTEYNCSSSIKVKDEESGNVYSVGAHNLSPADRISNIFLHLDDLGILWKQPVGFCCENPQNFKLNQGSIFLLLRLIVRHRFRKHRLPAVPDELSDFVFFAACAPGGHGLLSSPNSLAFPPDVPSTLIVGIGTGSNTSHLGKRTISPTTTLD